jgi:hypothetical protein
MKVETTLGTIMLLTGVTFLIGSQYGYYKTKEREYKKTYKRA